MVDTSSNGDANNDSQLETFPQKIVLGEKFPGEVGKGRVWVNNSSSLKRISSSSLLESYVTNLQFLQLSLRASHKRLSKRGLKLTLEE